MAKSNNGLIADVKNLEKLTDSFNSGQAFGDIKAAYDKIAQNDQPYRDSDDIDDTYLSEVINKANAVISGAEKTMTEAECVPFYKKTIPVVAGVVTTAVVLGGIGYKLIEAQKEKAMNAEIDLIAAKSEIKKLKPPVGKLRVLPEDERSDGEYFFSSDAKETISLVYQERPHGAYLFQGIGLKDHSWYFEVTSNGKMQLCVNFKDYNIEQRQKLIAAARKRGFAFGFRENADGTGIYSLIINGNGAEERGYKFDITNTSPGAGNLGLSGEGAIEKLIAKRKKQIEKAEAARKTAEPVAEPNEPAPEPREPADVNEPETTTRRYLDLPNIDSEPNQPK